MSYKKCFSGRYIKIFLLQAEGPCDGDEWLSFFVNRKVTEYRQIEKERQS